MESALLAQLVKEKVSYDHLVAMVGFLAENLSRVAGCPAHCKSPDNIPFKECSTCTVYRSDDQNLFCWVSHAFKKAGEPIHQVDAGEKEPCATALGEVLT